MKSCDFKGEFHTFVHGMVWHTFIGFQHVHWMLSSSSTLVENIHSYMCIQSVEIDVHICCLSGFWMVAQTSRNHFDGAIFHFGLFFNHVLGSLA